MTFTELKTAVKKIVFPIGEEENLVAQHDAYITDALNDIQQYVKCYRDNNVNIIAYGDTVYNCGLTVTDAPDGIIKRIYTMVDGCSKVNLIKSTVAKLRFWQEQHTIDFEDQKAPTQPTNKPALTPNDLYPGADSDSTLGRAITGWFALDGCRLYIWPYLQSTEDLGIEWTGVKDSYGDSDVIFDASTALQRAVRVYLQRERARDIEIDDALLAKYSAEYSNALATLIWRCRQKTEGVYTEEETLPPITNGSQNPALGAIIETGVLPGDTVFADNPEGLASGTTVPTTPTNPWLYRFAVIGNYGQNTAPAGAVAAMVNSWSPLFVVTTGGNGLGTDTSIPALDMDVGTNYHQYINPYVGTQGTGSPSRNSFWPTVSDYEWFNTATLSTYKQYFPLPTENGENYYDHIEGPVHFFFLDSNPSTPDGNSATSTQAEWLRVKLATSPCKYKVVSMFRTAYSSYADGQGNTGLNWPFAAWGATVVLNGQPFGYERILADGINYITNGIGAVVEAPGTLDPFSRFTYNAQVGAQLVTVNCDSVRFELYSVDGKLQDSLLIQ